MYFINNSKEAPDVWHRYETKEGVDEHMNKYGGTYTVQHAEKFNPHWIEEEAEFRKVFEIYDAGPESGTYSAN